MNTSASAAPLTQPRPSNHGIPLSGLVQGHRWVRVEPQDETMKDQDIARVWADIDRSALAELAQSGANCLFASISGAHLYGFASPDSDVDLRGAFITPAQQVLALDPPRETVDETCIHAGVELDWVAHDLRKFVRLLLRHNGYVLEQLYSPLVVVTSPQHAELRVLAGGCITRPTARHYLGFGRSRRERLAQPKATVKHLLYAYRVYATGVHMMRTGRVVSHLPSLVSATQHPAIFELIERKRQGAEKQLLDNGELDAHTRDLEAWQSRLEQAFEASRLPDVPQDQDALDDFVVRTRLASSSLISSS